MVGMSPISFVRDGTNILPLGTVMDSTNPDEIKKRQEENSVGNRKEYYIHPVEVQYESGTEITQS